MIGISRTHLHDRRMFTVGSERLGLRVVRGKLDRHGHWHDWRPDIFLLYRGRRVSS